MPEDMQVQTASTAAGTQSLFRADVDQSGHWYVWRRLGANGWATFRHCETRERALELAKHLNTHPINVM